MRDEWGKKKYLLPALAAALVIVPERAFAAESAPCPPERAIEIQQKEIPGDELRESWQESGAAQEDTSESKGEDVGEETGAQEEVPGSGGADGEDKS